MCLAITKTNLMKNKFYLFFAGFKTTYVINDLKRPRTIVYHSVYNTM